MPLSLPSPWREAGDSGSPQHQRLLGEGALETAGPAGAQGRVPGLQDHLQGQEHHHRRYQGAQDHRGERAGEDDRGL